MSRAPTPPSPLLLLPAAVPGTGPRSGVPAHLGDPTGEQRAAQGAAALVDASWRDVLRVGGPDRLGWLHDLTTQALSGLRAGDATRALVLSPHGHVEHDAEVLDDGTATWLDVEGGTGESLARHLDRMRFLREVDVALVPVRLLSLLGPAADEVARAAGLPVPAVVPAPVPGQRGAAPRAAVEVVVEGLSGWLRRRADGGLDLLLTSSRDERLRSSGDDEAAGRLVARLVHAGARPAGTDAADAVQVAARRPRVALDADERTLPHELGLLGEAVHLEKGCYRGQETVARVQNLGRPPRRLVLVHLDGSEVDLPPTGTALEPADGGRPVGRLGGPVRHHELGPVALALVKRSADVSAALRADGIAAAVDPDDVPVPADARAPRPVLARLR